MKYWSYEWMTDLLQESSL